MISTTYLFLVICGTLWSVSSGVTTRGSVQLDSLTFDKVVSKFKSVLVKFDTSYPYGEKHDTFASVSKEIGSTPELLLAEVGIQDYGDHENQDLGDRFNLKKDDLPKIMLFKDSDLSQPIVYDETEWSPETLKVFIRKNTGIRFVLEKCIGSFDDLAEDFMKSSDDDNTRRQAILDEVKAKVLMTDDEKKSADIYIKLMQRVIERGSGFIASEAERVKNLLSGKLSESKKQDLNIRKNILQSFMIEKSDGGDTKSEL